MAGTSKKQSMNSLKKGFQDIQTVIQDGNFKLFAKQVVVIIALIFLLRYANGKFAAQIAQNTEQVNSIQIQQQSEQDYLTNKERLFSLEPRFPDVDKKNEWLISQILDLFQAANVQPQLEGTQSEDASNATYVVAGQNVGAAMGYMQLGKFLERIENDPNYIRISEVSITKDTDPNAIGNNKIGLRFNTIFPKEKIGAKLFKDYEQQIEERREKNGKKGGK